MVQIDYLVHHIQLKLDVRVLNVFFFFFFYMLCYYISVCTNFINKGFGLDSD